MVPPNELILNQPTSVKENSFLGSDMLPVCGCQCQSGCGSEKYELPTLLKGTELWLSRPYPPTHC